MGNNENNTSQTVLRVLVILGILVILIFLSIGIVRLVPKAINALANASVSITSLFDREKEDVATSTATSTGGFIVISTSTRPVGTSTNSGTRTPPTSEYNRPVTSPTNRPSSYVPGTPDLVVSIIEKGIIQSSTGQFVPTNTFTTNDVVVVKFRVENRGVGSSGTWNLRVLMPSLNSADQLRDIIGNGSIPPGRAVEGQAVFDRPRSDSNPTVVITADPANTIAELDEANNTASAPLAVSGSVYGGGPIGGPITGGTYQPDLVIGNIQTGIMSGNQFYPSSNLQGAAKVAVRFEIANTGTTPTGPWYFRAELSDTPTKIYNSGAEASIPGSTSVTYVIEFDNVRTGNNSVSIFLDPNNYLVEASEANNSASTGFIR